MFGFQRLDVYRYGGMAASGTARDALPDRLHAHQDDPGLIPPVYVYVYVYVYEQINPK
jgi:hypothetical protein